jgi:hypothetical protein
MADEKESKQITPEFIERMVDRVIYSLSGKLEQLDVSMDYVAAAILDDVSAAEIRSRQKQRGRMTETEGILAEAGLSAYIEAFKRQQRNPNNHMGLIKMLAKLNYPPKRVESILATARYKRLPHVQPTWFGLPGR